tara:strand:- start:75417 stop:75620 length:204 start_codon:yes stop_codon:yes gene_type:complete
MDRYYYILISRFLPVKTRQRVFFIYADMFKNGKNQYNKSMWDQKDGKMKPVVKKHGVGMRIDIITYA